MGSTATDLDTGASKHTYSMPRYVHACSTIDGIVMLDLRNDAYFGFDGEESRLLRTAICSSNCLRDNDLDTMVHRTPDEHAKARDMAEQLVRMGLLVRGKAPGNRLGEPIGVAEEEILDSFKPGTATPTLGHWIQMLASCLWARGSLRFRSLDRLVENVRVYKSRVARAPDSAELERARVLTAAFDHMQPFVYRQQNSCLLDSLARLHFLLHYNVSPSWVIGVQTRPFKAHTWLQLGRYVLNSEPILIKGFSPIFAV